MNALKCRTLATLYTGQWAFFQLPSDLFRTGEFLDKISQIAEETFITTIDKA